MRSWLQLAKWYILPNHPRLGHASHSSATKPHHPQHAREDLWLLLIVSGDTGLGIVGLYALMSDTLVRLVFTDKFIAAVPLVFWTGLAILTLWPIPARVFTGPE